MILLLASTVCCLNPDETHKGITHSILLDEKDVFILKIIFLSINKHFKRVKFASS